MSTPNQELYIFRSQRYYKIGIANSPHQRLDAIRTGNPHNVELIDSYKVEDAQKAEKELHDRLANKKAKREWFQLDHFDGHVVEEVLNKYGIELDNKRHDKLFNALGHGDTDKKENAISELKARLQGFKRSLFNTERAIKEQKGQVDELIDILAELPESTSFLRKALSKIQEKDKNLEAGRYKIPVSKDNGRGVHYKIVRVYSEREEANDRENLSKFRNLIGGIEEL